MSKEAIIKEMQDGFKKSIEVFARHIAGIQLKPSENFFDAIRLETNGRHDSIKSHANISVMDARALSVQVWDAGMVGHVHKAIQAANLGVSCEVAGNVIRVALPQITTDGKRRFVDLVKRNLEDSKIALRNVRREAHEKLKKSLKAKEVSEDVAKKGEAEITKLLDAAMAQIEAMAKKKEEQITNS